ncbi:hypothetical protein ABE527_18910 [Brucella sp. TWI432]
MATEYPVGTHVLLYRMGGSWSVISCYPVGFAVPSDAMKFDLRTKDSFEEAYAHILQFHLDPTLTGGYDPEKDETSESGEIPDGAIIDLERDRNSWKAIIRYPLGGMSFRAAPYRSIKEALDGISMNSVL